MALRRHAPNPQTLLLCNYKIIYKEGYYRDMTLLNGLSCWAEWRYSTVIVLSLLESGYARSWQNRHNGAACCRF